MLKILQLLITIMLIPITGSDFMNDYKFGNFLCMLREKNGMTQADLASKLGVTPAAVSKWENGSSKPRVEILFQIKRRRNDHASAQSRTAVFKHDQIRYFKTVNAAVTQ